MTSVPTVHAPGVARSRARPVARARPARVRPPCARAACGFTLIELLVTITIIAILTGAVLLSVDFRNVGVNVRDVTRRTALLMNLASDQAVYAGTQFGIRFHPESYEFWILAPPEKEGEEPEWQPFFDERLNYEAPDVPIEFQVEIADVPITLESFEDELGDATDEDPLKPHILFLSNGEVMPDFRIIVADAGGEYRWSISTGEVEPLVVEQLDSP